MNTVKTPMQKMIEECDGDEAIIGERIAGVLEFLTMRAVLDAPFTIFTDDKRAVAVFAADQDVDPVVASLPSNVKDWATVEDNEDFVSDRDLGDEQEEVDDESSAEQE